MLVANDCPNCDHWAADLGLAGDHEPGDAYYTCTECGHNWYETHD